jgi:hypothetical protein
MIPFLLLVAVVTTAWAIYEYKYGTIKELKND